MKTIHTTKFMDNTLSFRQMLPLDEQTITVLNLLILMMRGRSEKYPGRDAWSTAVNHAYAAKVMTGMTGYGNQVLLDTRIKYLRPEYIDDPNYMNEILDLSDQALNHPVLTEETLAEAKYLLKNRLLAARENPDVLAVQSVLKIAEPGHSIGIPIGGILEKVDDVTLEEVKNMWDLISKTPYHIYSVGELDEKMLEFLNDIPQSDAVKLEMDLLSAHEPAYMTQEKELSQSSLAQVYATGIMPGSEESYALLLMNSILGASPMSLLFEEVREKHSYCYSISSSLIRYDGAVLVLTGTNKENLDHVKELIAKQIERIASKDFPLDKLESARLTLVDGIISQQDLDLAMINQAFVNKLLNRELSSKQLIDKIQSVTMDQIAEAAKKMHLVAESIVLQCDKGPVQSEEDITESFGESPEGFDMEGGFAQ